MEKIEVRMGRRGRPRKLTKEEYDKYMKDQKLNEEVGGPIITNPYDLFKKCHLTYDQMNGRNWSGEKYEEKVITLIKTVNKNGDIKTAYNLSRGIKEFEETYLRQVFYEVYPTRSVEYNKDDLLEKLNRCGFIIIRGENDNRAYIFKVSNNPHITEFQVGGLTRFLNKGYSCKQIIDRVLATLEFFGENATEFNNNKSATKPLFISTTSYLVMRRVKETLTVTDCNRESLKHLITNHLNQFSDDELKQMYTELDKRGVYYKYTDDTSESDYIVVIEYKTSSKSTGIDFKKLAKHEDKNYWFTIDEMAYGIKTILDGLYVLSPEFKEEDKDDK